MHCCRWESVARCTDFVRGVCLGRKPGCMPYGPPSFAATHRQGGTEIWGQPAEQASTFSTALISCLVTGCADLRM